jgi:hypothetical protein
MLLPSRINETQYINYYIVSEFNDQELFRSGYILSS